MSVKILQRWDIKVIPLWFPHIHLSPFLKIEHMMSWRNESGIWVFSHLRRINWNIIGFRSLEDVYLRISTDRWSVPALWFFAYFMVLLNSSGVEFLSSSMHAGLLSLSRYSVVELDMVIFRGKKSQNNVLLVFQEIPGPILCTIHLFSETFDKSSLTSVDQTKFWLP